MLLTLHIQSNLISALTAESWSPQNTNCTRVTLTLISKYRKNKGYLKAPYFQKLDFEWKSEAGTTQSSRPVFCQSGYFIKLKVHSLLMVAVPAPFCKKPKANQEKQQNHHNSGTHIIFIFRCKSSCFEQSPSHTQGKGTFRISWDLER